MRYISGYVSVSIACCAFKLSLLVCLRLIGLSHAECAEVDFDKAAMRAAHMTLLPF